MEKGDKIVSIVITYNAERWVDKCFGSLTNLQLSNHTILAIDNGSKDNTIEILKNKFSQVVIIETGNNIGFGKANNIGLKWALELNAEYIFLLNQDAWVFENTINSLIAISKKNHDYGIISPVHLNNTQKIDDGFAYYCLKGANSSFIFDSFCSNPLKEIYETNYINAAAWLMTRECLEKNGGFMPIFPHYGEDVNYCERVQSSGLKIGFTPGCTIIHDRNLLARKIPLLKKITQLYVHFLVIFASGTKKGAKAYLFYCVKESFKTVKLFIKQPLILLSIPIALIKILLKSKQIFIQRKQAKKLLPNFLE
ncbi:MAG: glycosyltransferase family 2 protein [Draconibacterium sp.]